MRIHVCGRPGTRKPAPEISPDVVLGRQLDELMTRRYGLTVTSQQESNS